MSYNILFISQFVPYNNVGHAGGKTLNFYIKQFSKVEEFNIRLLTFANKSDKDKIDLDKYKIKYDIIYNSYNKRFISKLHRFIINFSQRFNPFDKFAGLVNKYEKNLLLSKLNEFKFTNYKPDIIILEWTQSVLLISDIKEIFPNSKYVASEHDVSFLSFYRKFLNENNKFKKNIAYIKYVNLKKAELNSLSEFNLILPHNVKDKELLCNIKNDFNKITNFIHPYYMNFSILMPHYNNKNIIFFGDMSRMENYKSCIWFIEKVFYKLIKLDNNFKFFIIGGRPNKELTQYSSNNIIVTGFVDNVGYYFENSLCMVVPLLLGGGIKVKVIEGMSAGLPVLTNEIGIEGIPASKNDYINCKNEKDYIDNILMLSNNIEKAKQIGANAKIFVSKYFNLENSFEKYKNLVLQLIFSDN